MMKTKKSTSKELLLQIYKQVNLKDGRVNYSGLNWTPDVLFNIVDSGSYKPVVDWECILNTIFNNLSSTRENKSSMKLSDKKCKELVEETDKFLKSLPLKYHLLLPLPRNFQVSPGNKNLNEHITFLSIGESELEKYKTSNPEPDNTVDTLNWISDGNRLHILPKKGTPYMKVSCTGYIAQETLVTHELDPIYLYKIFISLCLTRGLLIHNPPASDYNSIATSPFTFSAYQDDNTFVTAISRPVDEERLLRNHAFNKSYGGKLNECTQLFKKLITKFNKETESIRNKIINSLYWYYEVSKADNPNIKTTYYTSSFDPFFQQNDTKESKARLVAAECAETAQQEKVIHENLVELYKKRNDVVHGATPLFDYKLGSKSKNRTQISQLEALVSPNYKKYITKQLLKFDASSN